MKKVLLVSLALCSLLFASCKKDSDDREALLGSYYGKISMKGTRTVDDGAPQSVSQSMYGYFTIAKDGSSGNRVTINIIGFDYGSLSGSVDGNTLTVDPLHTTVEETTKNTKTTTAVDLVFDPAKISDNHLTLNGSLHTLTTTVTTTSSSTTTSTEDLQAALLIESDKQ